LHNWIYLGNDIKFGSIYISKNGNYLYLSIYDPRSKTKRIFALRSGLGFIYLLKLDKYLEAKKHELYWLWQRYLDIRRKLKRWLGVIDSLEVLDLDVKSLQTLYNEVMPIVRARGYKVRLRQLYTNDFWKPSGVFRRIETWLQISVVRPKRNESWREIRRKVLRKVAKARLQGLIRPKSIIMSTWNPICLRGWLGKPIVLETLIDPYTLVEKHFDHLYNEVKSILKSMVREETEKTKMPKFSMEIKPNLQAYELFLRKLLDAKAKGKICIEYFYDEAKDECLKSPVVIDYKKPSDVDDLHYELYIDICFYKKSKEAWSHILAIYDRGRVKLIYIEPFMTKKGKLRFKVMEIVGEKKLRVKRKVIAKPPEEMIEEEMSRKVNRF